MTIPAPVRRAAGIESGQRLVARRIQNRVTTATAGHTGSAAAELIAERRAEAAREDSSGNATVSDAKDRRTGRA
ncbi:hypothetical protein [Amycolatopsis pithecellobii]|uniref:hypothetical protein n=1 Tax=Amycolatopsis pithecellobii TaxID=664692 RepID=UPI001FE44280|nr:hypothetical protein [Amycolatopsis pithecellobii]